jgi:hypothetical protein
MRDAIIILDTRTALDGMITTRDITVITPHIMRLITRVITKVISRIIIHHSRHAERALRKISTITITITTSGGTFGKEESRVRKQFAPISEIYVLWPGFPGG